MEAVKVLRLFLLGPQGEAYGYENVAGKGAWQIEWHYRAEASKWRGSSLRSRGIRTTLGISEEQATLATKLAKEVGETLIDQATP